MAPVVVPFESSLPPEAVFGRALMVLGWMVPRPLGRAVVVVVLVVALSLVRHLSPPAARGVAAASGRPPMRLPASESGVRARPRRLWVGGSR